MATVSNKTHKPLSIPLPRGKTLHLGPGKTGQISAKDVEHAQLKKLVDAGEIEVVSDDAGHGQGSAAGVKGRSFLGSYAPSSAGRRSGDR